MDEVLTIDNDAVPERRSMREGPMAREAQRPVLLREAIKERIVERILGGTYGPGERIVESAVAAEFGVSRAPIREAVRDLEAMRFVESHPHRGARVREVSTEEL